jgi:hypothetical protein
MIDRNSNKESKLWLIAAVVTIQSKFCLYINLYKYYRHVCFFFILHLHQHLMHSLDLKTVDKVVYQRENSSVQAKVGHGENPIWSSFNSDWMWRMKAVSKIPAWLKCHFRDIVCYDLWWREFKALHNYCNTPFSLCSTSDFKRFKWFDILRRNLLLNTLMICQYNVLNF